MLEYDHPTFCERLGPCAIERADRIIKETSKADLYEQLGEEAAELAKCALKMSRILRGTNPTPKTTGQATDDLIEEFTDVMLVANDILGLKIDPLLLGYKLYRWDKRLRDAKESAMSDFDCEACKIDFGEEEDNDGN